jgi:hypothetical protein
VVKKRFISKPINLGKVDIRNVPLPPRNPSKWEKARGKVRGR